MADILRNPQEYIQNVFKEDDDSTSEDSDPVDAITTIQKDNKIRVPSLEPALCLMDLHDLPRRDVHHTLFETLKEMLISKLEVLEPRSIKRLLDKSFAFVNVPELRQVVMKILETMPKPINEKYVPHLCDCVHVMCVFKNQSNVVFVNILTINLELLVFIVCLN